MEIRNKLQGLFLFAGIGAPEKALKNIYCDFEAETVEIDKYAVASYNAVHGTKIVPTSIIGYKPKRTEYDLVFHGSPCQDFSTMGKQAGGEKDSGTRSSLLFETVRILKEVKAITVIWENVKGALKTKAFKDYITEMETLGYRNEIKVLNANDFGLPQNRERIFVVSILKEIDFTWPEYHFNFNKVEKKWNDKKLQDYLVCKERPYEIKPSIKRLINNETVNKLDRTKKRDIINGEAYTADRYVAINEVNTLRAGGAFQLAYIYHEIIRLQPLEYWLLMGFTEKDYNKAEQIGMSGAQLYKQAGNSIAVPVLEAIFEALYD